MYDGETPDITTINDYLWFETDSIYEAIGLNSDGEIPSIVEEFASEEEKLKAEEAPGAFEGYALVFEGYGLGAEGYGSVEFLNSGVELIFGCRVAAHKKRDHSSCKESEKRFHRSV